MNHRRVAASIPVRAYASQFSPLTADHVIERTIESYRVGHKVVFLFSFSQIFRRVLHR